MRRVIPHASCTCIVTCTLQRVSHMLRRLLSLFRQACLCLEKTDTPKRLSLFRGSKRPSICLSSEHLRHHCVAALRPCVTLAHIAMQMAMHIAMQMAMQIAMLRMRRHSLLDRLFLFLYPLISFFIHSFLIDSFFDRLFVYRFFLLSKGGF